MRGTEKPEFYVAAVLHVRWGDFARVTRPAPDKLNLLIHRKHALKSVEFLKFLKKFIFDLYSLILTRCGPRFGTTVEVVPCFTCQTE